ncbi:hypothetical protein [Vibrio mexicanus]|uniref:hypothetical protein n=1 Tax=Vibrio mexicanus TaxID=1004326 RepID=UPI00063CA547|nr:hypothetical protein [Vibrio mexicanus]
MSVVETTPPWLLVLVGLILNVLAILMSSVVLERLGGDVTRYLEQKEENQHSIQLAWSSVETLERKREALLLHIQTAQNPDKAMDKNLSNALKGQMSVWVLGDVPDFKSEHLPELMMLIDQAQRAHRNKIDDYFLDNLAISEKVTALEDRIAWYKSVALFLQVFGLALLLARDLARRN